MDSTTEFVKTSRREYLKYFFHGFRLLILPDWLDREFLALVCRELPTDNGIFMPVASSVYARVFRFHYSGRVLFYKSFLRRKRLDVLKDCFRPSRAARALQGYCTLSEEKFHSPRVVLVGQNSRQNFMVTEAVPHARDIYQLFLEDFAGQPRAALADKRRMIKETGDIIGRLHACGIFHGDLRWGNILVDSAEIKKLKLYFLDNERTVRYRRLPRRKRLKNLVQMNMIFNPGISRTDRLRFWKGYLRRNPELLPGQKWWIRKIAAKTAARRKGKTADKCTSCVSCPVGSTINLCLARDYEMENGKTQS